ncbi:MAG: hypothetical protein Q8P32_00720 [Candidatus Komeilibacteria bacterium]|nr:hypothetical protein [Candidatus Komeilibacteria bacterium]
MRFKNEITNRPNSNIDGADDDKKDQSAEMDDKKSEEDDKE